MSTMGSMRRSRTSRLSGVLLALAMVLAACGGEEEPVEEEPLEEEPVEEKPLEEEPVEEEPAEEEPAEGEAAGEGDADPSNEIIGAELTWEDGVLQPLEDGFPEREITLVVVDDPGTRDAIYAADMASAVADLSPVEFVVSHEPHPQGGTLPTMSELIERPGGTEGYYPEVTDIIGTVTDVHIAPIENEWGLGVEDVTFVTTTEELPHALAISTDAEWGSTFEEFVEYGRNNPGELRYVSAGVGSAHDIGMMWMLSELGIEVEKVPAQGHQEALAAIGAGEGDFTMTRPGLAFQNEQSGRVDVIYVTSNTVPAPWEEGEVASSQVLIDEYDVPDVAWGTVLGFMVPAETPDPHVAWLAELFNTAASTEEWQQRAEANPGLNIYDEPFTVEEANELGQTVHDSSEPVIREIGMHWEDNQ